MPLLGPVLSAAAAPLIERLGSLSRACESIAVARVGGVQLSAATPGLRPRELDRRARQDVLSTVARQGLAVTGVDLMIRPGHWLDPATQDRAVGAALAAVDLARDWSGVPLCLALPVGKLSPDIQSALVAGADARGVTLAVHAENEPEALEAWIARIDQPSLRAALDPAALLGKGHDPAEAAVRWADRLAVARLDDHASGGMDLGRCPVGEGDLDVAGYRAALAAARRLRSVVIELRELRDPVAALGAAAGAWDAAVRRLG
jgi:sugar phosphate isomerase/epimerase